MLIIILTEIININDYKRSFFNILVRRNMYMDNEFINYMEKYTDFEEMKAVAYITLSVILAIIISLQVEKYYESLFQAYQKEINGEALTKKEKKKAEKYKKMRKNELT